MPHALRFAVFAVVLATAAPAVAQPTTPDTVAAAPVEVGVRPGGGGLYVAGPGYLVRLLGYVQANFTAFDSALDRPDRGGDFFVRRARVDFLMTLQERYTLFIEFDGAPTAGTTTDSDFALVEAYVDAAVAGEALHVRAGKYIVPVSAENLRSSRSLETVERYLALNSLFVLPGLDTQFGVMVHGRLGPKGRFGYAVGVFNGNGLANANLSDDNGAKEWVARLTYDQPSLSVGAAVDYAREEAQTLSLVDLGFNRYVSVAVAGERLGFEADAFAERGRYSLRAEGLAFRFDAPEGGDVGFTGGYVQPAVFVRGDAAGGLQLLVRFDVSHLDAGTSPDGSTMWAFLGGGNWYVGPNLRVQVNAVAHRFDGPSALRGFDEARWTPMLQTEVQLKF